MFKADDIFPLPGAREAFANLQEIYTACGAVDLCKLVSGPQVYPFFADLAWSLMREVIDSHSL